MSHRARLSVASAATPATLPDLNQHAHDHSADIMDLDFSAQLLTPENSRSETSSNNENASTDDKPPRRTSARVTRASLRGIEELANSEMEVDKDTSLSEGKIRTVSGETLVDSVSEGQAAHSSQLRHSIAVMESSLWSQTTLTKDHMEIDDGPKAPDTPVSKSSQEPQQPEDLGSSLPQRTLRKRIERVLTKTEKEEQEKAASMEKVDPEKSLRRSSRLSLLEKASDLVEKASGVLGKRSRDVMEKGKEIGRRASLRPRNVVQLKEEPTAPAASEPPAAKKRRVSESDLPSNSTSQESEETPAPKPVVRPRIKRWLSHGLYTGQDHTDSRPSQNNRRNAKKKSTSTPQQRKLLPLPMFTGDRLLKNGRDFNLPFDIFSPLPPGQPKPDEWKRVNKNVFVGEAASIWRANKNMELSTCTCLEETGCDENCQNRYMFYECDEGNCRLGPQCGNRSFEELKQRTKVGGKYNIGVEVIKTEDRGYGVRSNRTFEPNQIIVEYTGEIITQAECESRMRTIYKKNECYYLMYFDQNMIIDATRGSIARFVNHSCEPNCRMEKWTVAGKPRMALFAGDRGIMTGEELTYDYNFDPYSHKNVQQCRCGSAKCRGILGPRPKEKEARREAREAKEALLEDKEKTRAVKKKATAKVTGTKRKNDDPPDEPASKKRKLLTPKSIKAGVKKVVARARTTVTKKSTAKGKDKKATTKKLTKATKAPASKAPAKGAAAKSKTNVKLPQVKSKAKVKATVPSKTKKASSSSSSSAAGKAQTTSPATTQVNKLNRPSAATKAKILAAAKKGTSVRKQTTSVKKAETKGSSKANGGTKGATKAQSTGKSVKSAAKSVMNAVKGGKKDVKN